MMSHPLLVGACRVDITPAVGGHLYGYNPDVVSDAIHDPLYATALALTQQDQTVLLVSLTLCDFQTALCDELRAFICARIGLPVTRLMVGLTHTHSAPNVAGAPGWGGIDRPYFDGILLPQTAKACEQALQNRKEAELAIGTTESYVGINRRNYDLFGNTVMNQNPWGYLDKTMTLLSFRETKTKKGIFNLIHYGCHGTAAGINHEVTRDWSGVMEDRIEQLTGTPTAFYNGPFGDVGPRLTNGETTGDIRYVEELGAVAAQDAWRAYQNLGGYHLPKLTVIEGEISLPYAPIPEKEALLQKIAAMGDPGKLEGLDATLYAQHAALLQMYEQGVSFGDALTLPQTIICLGDVVFYPAPFELFSETALKFRQFTPHRHALTLSNANGYCSYLPTAHEFCHGGYEVESFLYYNVPALQPNTEQSFVRENIRLWTEHLPDQEKSYGS